jgi:hypothetical protein
MRTGLFLLLCLFFCTISYSQNIILKGSIQDSEGIPLESATVYLSSVKDSSVVDYTISNKNGSWELKTRKITQPVFLKVSFVSYTDYKEKFESVTEDKDFGTIKLQERTNELDAVVVVSEIPPIRVKKDTLEFNASSFKVRPDANVESLLKQLPGVDIDNEGKITVNGKEVNQILVNGKPFFDKDGKIALQNLPAEIIDKVQVTDTKTKKEEMTGEAAEGNNSSINLTIQEDKNKGFFGKLMGGYGSDERYESSALINYFKDKRKISLLASSNNINSTGFSMDEIFDNMRGGRNSSVWMNDEGGFGINGMEFGGSAGITRSNMIGASYADEWVKGLEPSANYFFNSAITDNANRRRQTTLIPVDTETGITTERSLTTESSSVSNSDRFAHNLNTAFEVKMDSTTSIYFEPRFVLANSKTKSSSQQSTVNEENELQNQSAGDNFGDTDTYSFNSNLEFFKAFKKKGRHLTLSFNNENKRDNSENITQSSTFFYEDVDGDGITDVTSDIRNQSLNNRNTRDKYEGEIEFAEPITDSLKMTFGVNYRRTEDIENRLGLDFDPATGNYTDVSPDLTMMLNSQTSMVTPTAGLSYTKGKFYIRATGGPKIADYKALGAYTGENYAVNRNFVLPSVNSSVHYRFGKSTSLYASYNYNVDFPQARQVLPILDVSSPLSTQTGNANLDPNRSHYFYMGVHDYDWATRSGYSIYAGGSFYDEQIVSTTDIVAGAKRFTSYTNVSGTYNGWAGVNWDKSIKREAHTFKFGLGFSSSMSLSKGITNNQLYEANQIRFSPNVELGYEYGELVTIRPSYSYSYNRSNYSNYIIDEASNFTHTLNLETTSYWPKHFVFGNDFGYTYNSNIEGGFKKDFYLWNSSLGYNFLNDKVLFKVKVYDVLNQNLGTSRTITPTSITDQENTVLKRYVMFSLTLKIEKFGGKEKKEGDRFWMF